VASLTDMVKVHYLELTLSVAARVTDVSSTGNTVPDCCINVTVGPGLQSSIAPAAKLTIIHSVIAAIS